MTGSPTHPAHAAHAETLRRFLLGLVVALLVARPLVIGEDPGFLSKNTSGTSLFLSVLWLVAGIGTAVWCLWNREGRLQLGGVLLSLGVLVLLIVRSAFAAAHYKHPASLIAWEWVILFVAFLSLRQLIRSDDDVRCLLAALVASAASLAAFAIYQHFVELPALRATYADPSALQNALLIDRPEDSYVQFLFKRIQENNVFATYAHPNSFAGFLVLFIPAGLAWCVETYRTNGRSRLFWATVAALGVMLLGLWFTHSRGAILGLFIACLAWIGIGYRSNLAQHRGRILIGLPVIALGLLMMSQTAWGSWVISRGVRSFGLRTDYWTATWSMIKEHLWSGVGPGNFGRLYPRYMLPTAFERIQDPHNLILEIWATSGVMAAFALACTLGSYLWFQWRLWRFDASAPSTSPDFTWYRLDILLGGMAGLILGFLLRVSELAASEILSEGLLSAGRAVLWFASYALLAALPLSCRTFRGAILAGIVALVLNLGISGGISQPSVSTLLLTMVALGLTGPLTSAVPSARARRWDLWLRLLLLPATLLLLLLFLFQAFYPILGATTALGEVHQRAVGWHQSVKPRWQDQVSAKGVKPDQVIDASREASNYLNRYIFPALAEGQKQDPENAELHAEAAYWLMEQGDLFPQAEEIVEQALTQIRASQKLDRDNREYYLTEARIHLVRTVRFPKRAKEAQASAIRAFKATVERDPTDARLRFELANVLFQTGDTSEGRRQASIARQLSDQASTPERQLTEQQIEQLTKWLVPTPAK